MKIDQNIIEEILEILTSLIEDIPSKARIQLKIIIENLNDDSLNLEKLLIIRDDLDLFSGNSGIDSYTRNQIYNVLSLFETLF